MSGVYDVGALSAFQNDSKASPMKNIHAGAPPFLVEYCENDYPFLPLQARLFDAALRKAGNSSQLLYVPGENHISEIVNATKDENIIAQAIVAQTVMRAASLLLGIPNR